MKIWLTLGPVTEKITEQCEIFREYFLEFLPKTGIKASSKYNEICSFPKDSKNLLYLHFIAFILTCSPYLLTAIGIYHLKAVPENPKPTADIVKTAFSWITVLRV